MNALQMKRVDFIQVKIKFSSSHRLWLLLVFVLLSACGDKSTPEEQVREYLAVATNAAEARDVLAIRDLIAANYHDAGGRDKRSLVGLTTGYFLRHKNIHLFTQVDSIRFPSANRSRVQLFVAMAGSPVSGAQALLDLRADLYRFDLSLLREDEQWLLQKADWQRAKVDELFAD
jgi:hypothetical protein